MLGFLPGGGFWHGNAIEESGPQPSHRHPVRPAPLFFSRRCGIERWEGILDLPFRRRDVRVGTPQ
jgi:hypothetical protein